MSYEGNYWQRVKLQKDVTELKQKQWRLEQKQLSNAEKEAVIAVINERLAGGSENWRDAIGCTQEEANKTFDLLKSALEKLV